MAGLRCSRLLSEVWTSPRWLLCGRNLHERAEGKGSRVLLQGSLTVSSLDARTSTRTSSQTFLHRRRALSSTEKEKAKKAVESKEGETTSDVDLSRVCMGLNYFKTGEDPLIQDNSEYPAWLWDILEPVKSYKELSPDTKMYWRRLNKQKAKDNNLRRKQMGR